MSKETRKVEDSGPPPAGTDLRPFRPLLEALASISPQGERQATTGDVATVWTGQYRIHRCGHRAILTGAEIQAAQECLADPAAGEGRWRAALRPLAQLPDDFRVESPEAVIYNFPGVDGNSVRVTNAMIRQARAFCGLA